MREKRSLGQHLGRWGSLVDTDMLPFTVATLLWKSFPILEFSGNLHAEQIERVEHSLRITQTSMNNLHHAS